MEENLIEVQLQIYWEQGMESVVWSAHDTTKQNYEGLILLEEKDYLKIPNIWEGYIKYDFESFKDFPFYIQKKLKTSSYREVLQSFGWVTKEFSDDTCKNLLWNNFKRQIVQGYNFEWLQQGVDPNLWLEPFKNEEIAYYKSVCL